MRTVRKPNSMLVMGSFLWAVFSLFFFFSMCHVNIATLNLNGARDMHKRAGLFEVIRQKKIDVTLLQETHSDLNNAADWAVEWNGSLSEVTILHLVVELLFFLLRVLLHNLIRLKKSLKVDF